MTRPIAGVSIMSPPYAAMKTPEYSDILHLPQIARDAWIIRFSWATPIALSGIFLFARVYVLAREIGR